MSTRIFLLVQLDFSSHPVQDPVPMGGAAHSPLGPPTSIMNPEKAPVACLQASFTEAPPQLGFVLPDCIQLARKQTKPPTGHSPTRAVVGMM